MKEEEEPEDPELAKYLNRSYWEQKQGFEKKTTSPDRYRNSPPSAPQTPTHQMVSTYLINIPFHFSSPAIFYRTIKSFNHNKAYGYLLHKNHDHHDCRYPICLQVSHN